MSSPPSHYSLESLYCAAKSAVRRFADYEYPGNELVLIVVYPDGVPPPDLLGTPAGVARLPVPRLVSPGPAPVLLPVLPPVPTTVPGTVPSLASGDTEANPHLIPPAECPGCLAAVLRVFVRNGGVPMTGDAIEDALEKAGERYSESTLNKTLCWMVKARVFENPKGARPRGYRFAGDSES